MIEIKTDNLIELQKIEKARMTFEVLSKKYPAILHSNEVAKLLGTQESTIRQWTRKGKIPHQKMDGFVRYILADLVFWLVNGGSVAIQQEINSQTQKRKVGRPRKEEVLKRQGLI